MRYKTSVEEKLERLESRLKRIGYNIKSNNRDEAFDEIGKVLEYISEIRTLLNKETQD